LDIIFPTPHSSHNPILEMKPKASNTELHPQSKLSILHFKNLQCLVVLSHVAESPDILLHFPCCVHFLLPSCWTPGTLHSIWTWANILSLWFWACADLLSVCLFLSVFIRSILF
jgi:hypothetical protein